MISRAEWNAAAVGMWRFMPSLMVAVDVALMFSFNAHRLLTPRPS